MKRILFLIVLPLSGLANASAQPAAQTSQKETQDSAAIRTQQIEKELTDSRKLKINGTIHADWQHFDASPSNLRAVSGPANYTSPVRSLFTIKRAELRIQ